MKVAASLLALYLLAVTRVYSQAPDRSRVLAANDSIQKTDLERRLDIISLGGEIYPSPGNGSFFTSYRTLGGSVEELDAEIAPVFALRLRFTDDLRAVISGTYLSSGFVDLYDVRAGGGDSARGEALASVVENFSIAAAPVLVGVEYSPIRAQFTSYVGVLAGIAPVSVEWTTSAREQTQGGYYRPGVNERGWEVSPAAKIYTGVDLRFDRHYVRDHPIRGIFIEAGYTWLPVHRDYFKTVNNGIRGSASIPSSDDANLQFGGFTVSVGLNMQFLRQ